MSLPYPCDIFELWLVYPWDSSRILQGYLKDIPTLVFIWSLCIVCSLFVVVISQLLVC
jgi:hypothetical protein